MAIIQGNAHKSSVSGFYPKTIEGSLRFNEDDTSYLTWSPSGTSSNGNLFTFSCWFKPSVISTYNMIWQPYQNGSNFGNIVLSSDKITVYSQVAGSAKVQVQTNAVYRDPSSWYHLVVKFNATSGSEEIKIYINGTEQSLTTTTAMTAHTTLFGQNGVTQYFGDYFNQSGGFDGYMAEVHFTDGTAYDADAFGEFKNGVWVAKTPDVTYGTNGFHLPFTGTTGLYTETTGGAFSLTSGNDIQRTQGNDSAALFSGLITGDFDIEFKFSPASSSLTPGDAFTVGFFPESGYDSLNYNSGFAGQSTYWVIQNGASGASAINNTDGSTALSSTTTSDVFQLTRTSGTFKIFKNDTLVHTFTTTGTDDGYMFFGSGDKNETITLLDITFNDVNGESSSTPFESALAIGGDASGRGNHWTSNNLEPIDVVLDSPTDNFCTWNPIAKQTGSMAGTPNLSDGNLTITSGSGDMSAHGTFLLSSGKWYWEITYVSGNSAYAGIAYNGSSTNREDGVVYWKDGRKAIDNVFTSYGASYSAGDVIGIALNADDNEITFYKNNVSQGVISYTPQSTDPTPAIILAASGSTTITANFGQQDFDYTPPEGYLALSTANLPDPEIDPAQGELPAKYFDTFLYTGNGSQLQVGDVIKKPADTIDITNSLIFDDGSSTYLSRTVGTATNTYTVSLWLKRSDIPDEYMYLFSSGSTGIGISKASSTGAGTLYIFSGSTQWITSSQKLLDTSTWYHIVLANNAGSASVYLNGQEIASGLTLGSLSTSANATQIGRYSGSGLYYLNGYLAEVHFATGTAYDADDFGNFDANGIWIPKAVSGISYGNDGAYLDFSDDTSTTTLGEDQAGSNDWTLNNFATTDQVEDSPTDNNFATFATDTNMTLSEGNKEIRSTSDFESAHVHIPCSGKNYFEIEYVTKSASNDTIGVVSYAQTTRNWGASVSSGTGTNGRLGYAMAFEYSRTDAGQECDEGSVTSSVFTALSAGDVAQIAVDTDTGNIWFGTDGTWENSGDPAAGTNPSTTKTWEDFTIALGGHPTNKFRIREESEWEYTAPTDFVALTENNITVNDQNLESPDFVWIKNRQQGDKHHLYDSVRGVQKALYSDVNTEETDEPNGLLDFNANGFTVGSEVEVNTANEDYVADGASNATVGHGLTVAPEMILVKNRSAVGSWCVYHSSLPSYQYILRLDSNGAQSTSNTSFGAAPSSTLFTVNQNSGTNNTNINTNDYIAYCFHSVEGFSKFGTYTGNNSTNGPFVYTGFRPAFLMVKAYNTTSSWVIRDTERDEGINDGDITPFMYADATTAESTISTSGRHIDFLSNGFKVRENLGITNSTNSFIYMAFAENPFKYSNAR